MGQISLDFGAANTERLSPPQGFNAINGSELAGALQSGLTYYQVCSSIWLQ